MSTVTDEELLVRYEKRLAKMKDELAGAEEVLHFTLSSTGHHISGRQRRKYETEVEQMRQEVAEMEKLVNRLQTKLYRLGKR